MARQHDAPGLILWPANTPGGVCAGQPPSCRRIFQLLTHAQARGRQPSTKICSVGGDLFAARFMVISDFRVKHAVIELLRQLEGQRQEVIVFHARARGTRSSHETEVITEDSETGEELPVHAEAFRAEYQSRLNEFANRSSGVQIQAGNDYQRLRTDSPLDGRHRVF
jgi:hypothetical protein